MPTELPSDNGVYVAVTAAGVYMAGLIRYWDAR